MAVLLVLAAATAWLSYYSTRDAAVAAPAQQRKQGRSQPISAQVQSVAGEVDSAAPMDEEAEVDPFAPRGWQAPPPAQEVPKAVMAVEPQPGPVAPTVPPPLPYKFMGRMNDDDNVERQMVYLSKGDQVFVVQSGETLDDAYSVLRIESDRIEFEHLPSGEKQILNIPANDK